MASNAWAASAQPLCVDTSSVDPSTQTQTTTTTCTFKALYENVIGSMSAGIKILYLTSFLVGASFIVTGLLKLRHHGHDNQHTGGHGKSAIYLLISGSCMIAIPILILLLNTSIFGNQGINLTPEGEVLNTIPT
ncbi:MAG: hypothetical protein EBX40_01380 [Gammaproteobacteria bacterium]|nr:hypothetical protein [Gammaproteobacteria bacterium]